MSEHPAEKDALLRADAIADWLGEMPESRNVFDHTDEATTVINIDVETLARRFAVEVHNSVAAALAAADPGESSRVTPPGSTGATP